MAAEWWKLWSGCCSNQVIMVTIWNHLLQIPASNTRWYPTIAPVFSSNNLSSCKAEKVTTILLLHVARIIYIGWNLIELCGEYCTLLHDISASAWFIRGCQIAIHSSSLLAKNITGASEILNHSGQACHSIYFVSTNEGSYSTNYLSQIIWLFQSCWLWRAEEPRCVGQSLTRNEWYGCNHGYYLFL